MKVVKCSSSRQMLSWQTGRASVNAPQVNISSTRSPLSFLPFLKKLIPELQKLFVSKNETNVLKLWPLFVKLLGKVNFDPEHLKQLSAASIRHILTRANGDMCAFFPNSCSTKEVLSSTPCCTWRNWVSAVPLPPSRKSPSSPGRASSTTLPSIQVVPSPCLKRPLFKMRLRLLQRSEVERLSSL